MPENTSKHFWKSLEERDADLVQIASAGDEFPEDLTTLRDGFGRRDFLKAAGFTLATAAMAGCGRAPVQKAIPFLVQPEEITPGVAYFYASTCDGCSAGCGLLVKNRDGRPIKLEGNPEHPMSRGGLCAVGQASLLGLYDSTRYLQPQEQGTPTTWEEADRAIAAQLQTVRMNRGAIRFLTGTVTSPTSRAMIGSFLRGFADGRHVSYDPLSISAILDAYERTHGARVLPRCRFDRVDVIASFDADFLGTWISPVEFTAGYRAGRALEGEHPRMSYHVQFESRMSVTGSKADRRVRVAPSELGLVMSQLAVRVARKAGAGISWSVSDSSVPVKVLDDLAERLWQARGRSLVVCGEQDVQAQVLCNFLNHLLNNYGATLDTERPSYQRQGNERELETLVRDLRDGKVAALFIHGVNPVFDLPGGDELSALLKKVSLVVSFAERPDETSALAHFVCPEPHRLESWADAEAVAGTLSLAQPTIHPIGTNRALIESLSSWMGAPKPAYDILRDRWQASVFSRQKKERSFQAFWDRSVHDGFAEVEPERAKLQSFKMAAVQPVPGGKAPAAGAFALVLYPKVGILDGRHSHNPWLQELPDPITKVAWDNYACLSPAAAARLGVADGDVVRIELGAGGAAKTLELPVCVQPGQHEQTVAVACGYGGKATERFTQVGPRWFQAKLSVGENGRVGKNVAPLAELRDGALRYAQANVSLVKTGKKQPLACTQDHHSIRVPEKLALPGGERREIIQETTLPVLLSGERGAKHEAHSGQNTEMWPEDHPSPGHRWAMVIDLSACTGCSACVVACQAENNIPVVGRDEVRRRRAMHWMRVDRYYSGPDDEVDVAHQPMFCQQCGHASCETVCPVLATVHSEEGLNQQVYNRCVGTRYCANNCAYKVRRFNWFDYPREERLQNMALNPDVTVRSRGVMEKCTFCVQRIQAAKIEAKQRGEKLSDGAIRTACQQSCPAQAIVFGDRNDPVSKVSQLLRSGRRYAVLGEYNFQPSVGYLKIVRNRPEGEGERHNG
ncbi:MAG: TAT-variant-translocated molybdopterin oxidoreductase [Acidobacteria bacterium]|nr:TAT-variant-translocated molybdopterin oxidoreductase [Acidobacteriota bacterium]